MNLEEYPLRMLFFSLSKIKFVKNLTKNALKTLNKYIYYDILNYNWRNARIYTRAHLRGCDQIIYCSMKG